METLDTILLVLARAKQRNLLPGKELGLEKLLCTSFNANQTFRLLGSDCGPFGKPAASDMI